MSWLDACSRAIESEDWEAAKDADRSTVLLRNLSDQIVIEDESPVASCLEITNLAPGSADLSPRKSTLVAVLGLSWSSSSSEGFPDMTRSLFRDDGERRGRRSKPICPA